MRALEPEVVYAVWAAVEPLIGRTAAYALAKEWRTTGGRSGLPVLELGRTLRVSRAALARLLEAPEADLPPSPVPSPTPGAPPALWKD